VASVQGQPGFQQTASPAPFFPLANGILNPADRLVSDLRIGSGVGFEAVVFARHERERAKRTGKSSLSGVQILHFHIENFH
jgi:hypothetical protein